MSQGKDPLPNSKVVCTECENETPATINYDVVEGTEVQSPCPNCGKPTPHRVSWLLIGQNQNNQ